MAVDSGVTVAVGVCCCPERRDGEGGEGERAMLGKVLVYGLACCQAKII